MLIPKIGTSNEKVRTLMKKARTAMLFLRTAEKTDKLYTLNIKVEGKSINVDVLALIY